MKEVGRQLVAAQPSSEYTCVMYISILCISLYMCIAVVLISLLDYTCFYSCVISSLLYRGNNREYGTKRYVCLSVHVYMFYVCLYVW